MYAIRSYYVYILDIVDHYINNYGVALAGLIEIVMLAWFFNLESVRSYVNPLSRNNFV